MVKVLEIVWKFAKTGIWAFL